MSCLRDGRGNLWVSADGARGVIRHGVRFLGGDVAGWEVQALRAAVPVGEVAFSPGLDADWRTGERLVLIDDRQHVYADFAAGLDRLRRQARRIPRGIRLRPLDAQTVGHAVACLGSEAIGLYRDPEDFLREGLGVCALEGVDVVAVATSLMRSGDRVELSVRTRPSHRRLGLATAAAARLLQACLSRSWRPVWQATHDGSRSLAERLGFADPVAVTAYLRIL